MGKFTHLLLIAKPKDVKTALKFLGHQDDHFLIILWPALPISAHWSPPSPAPPTTHWLGPLNSLVFVAWKPLLPPSGLLKLLFLEFALGRLLTFHKPFFSSQKSDFYEKRKPVHLTPPSGKVYWIPFTSGKQNFSPSGLTNFPFGLLPLFSLTNSFTVCLQRSTILLAFSNLITHGWANYIVHLHGYIKSLFFNCVFLF